MENKTNESQYFKGIVGQKRAKKALSFALDIQRNTGLMSNYLIVGGFGLGKTRICKDFASNIIQYPDTKIRPIVEINCASIEDSTAFWTDVIIPYVHKGSFTHLYDEAHKMPEDCQVMMLSLLNPNSENKNTYSYLGETITCDFRKNNFIFSTSDPNKLLTPLINRLNRVDMDSYNLEQLSELIVGELKDIKINSSLLQEMASVTRRNARQAIKLSQDIKNYSNSLKINEFNQYHWKDFCDKLSINPYGLNTIELRILKLLKERGQMSLTSLSAALNMGTETVRSFYESFLLSEGLIQIATPKGRQLTKFGNDYVNNLKEL